MDRNVRERQLNIGQTPARLFVWPFEMMLRLQASMAGTIRESTETWMERRQEAADDAVQAFEQLVHCTDISEAITIQQVWFERAIKRIDDDIGLFAKQSATISRQAASSAEEAGSRSFYGARTMAQQVQEAGQSLRAEGGPETEGEPEGEHGSGQQITRRRSRGRHEE